MSTDSPSHGAGKSGETDLPGNSRRFKLHTGALDVESTLDGGQAFRWWRVSTDSGAGTAEPVAYDGVIGFTAVRIIEMPADVQQVAGEAQGSTPTPATEVAVEVRSDEEPAGFRDTVADYLAVNTDLSALQAKFAR